MHDRNALSSKTTLISLLSEPYAYVTSHICHISFSVIFNKIKCIVSSKYDSTKTSQKKSCKQIEDPKIIGRRILYI